MKTESATIFLSDKRERFEKNNFRSLQTLINGPFGNLRSFSEDTLGGGSSMTLRFKPDDNCSVLIPLVGDVVTTERISPGQVHLIHDVACPVTNPQKDHLASYLNVRMTLPGSTTSVGEFDIDKSKNSLTSPLPFIHIGKFDGRRDGVLKINESSSGVFVFVIEGAFEVQNRLLHPRDGLSLGNVREVEFEALSNEAILLMIEVNSL